MFYQSVQEHFFGSLSWIWGAFLLILVAPFFAQAPVNFQPWSAVISHMAYNFNPCTPTDILQRYGDERSAEVVVEEAFEDV